MTRISIHSTRSGGGFNLPFKGGGRFSSTQRPNVNSIQSSKKKKSSLGPLLPADNSIKIEKSSVLVKTQKRSPDTKHLLTHTRKRREVLGTLIRSERLSIVGCNNTMETTSELGGEVGWFQKKGGGSAEV